MTKLDLYKKHKADYVAPKQPTLLDIKPARYLAISGSGDPQGGLFGRSMGALYAMAYTLKFASKAAGKDYKVAMPEGLWWCVGPSKDLGEAPKKDWRWTLVIRTPDFVTAAQRTAAVKALKAKGKDPLVSQVKLTTLHEGTCVQALHVGPYIEEDRTILPMLAHAAAQGYQPRARGKHHEIYLSDPRRVPPAKLRTILRLPVGKTATRARTRSAVSPAAARPGRARRPRG